MTSKCIMKKTFIKLKSLKTVIYRKKIAAGMTN